MTETIKGTSNLDQGRNQKPSTSSAPMWLNKRLKDIRNTIPVEPGKFIESSNQLPKTFISKPSNLGSKK